MAESPTEAGTTLRSLLPEERQGEVYAQAGPGMMPGDRRFYIESYGCQMNFSDSEIVASILGEAGFGLANSPEEADLILLNTCAIRDNAEQRIRTRLQELVPVKKERPDAMIGVLGCMAERLKDKLVEEEHLLGEVDGHTTLAVHQGCAHFGIAEDNQFRGLEGKSRAFGAFCMVDAGENRHPLGLDRLFEFVSGSLDAMGALDPDHAIVCGEY